jgi:hypothetical protein
MEKRRPTRWVVGILCLALGVAGVGLNALGSKQDAQPEPGGAGLILIDTLAASGKLSFPVVRFDHDKHTKAVEQKCEGCHTVHNGNRVVPKFKRETDGEPEQIKAIYHDNCMGCHEEMARAGKKSGPGSEQCRSCHAGSRPTIRVVVPFDASLHYRHVASQVVQPAPGQDNCAKCHTQDTPEKRNLTFAQNKEETHTKCLSCHMEVAKAKLPTGPVECSGCHDQAKRTTYKVLPNVPRLEAGQSASMLLMPAIPKLAGDAPLRRSVVPFDHKGHEAKVNGCSACHHDARRQGVPACSQCHTPAGKKEGNFITLEQAMHRPGAMEGCIGCHNAKKAARECAGCHEFLGRTTKSQEGSCTKCHVEMEIPAGLETNKKAQESIAQALLAAQPTKDPVINLETIPEVVEIGVLSQEYAPSKFPHRKIVKKIASGMEESKLAASFHSSPNAMCAGCHHNSPASANPPACATCHSRTFQDSDGRRPSLKAAYHQQCMGCHNAMGIQKPADTACTECHAKKQ